jgi:hypothetical protein
MQTNVAAISSYSSLSDMIMLDNAGPYIPSVESECTHKKLLNDIPTSPRRKRCYSHRRTQALTSSKLFRIVSKALEWLIWMIILHSYSLKSLWYGWCYPWKNRFPRQQGQSDIHHYIFCPHVYYIVTIS